ncbi:MAG: helix-turn-helix transcriptional regulator [Candidatus Pacebacteria bacterium]|nr:helix-turn-helix transcriptional regulator [Candidatus Paceibacterota bacterium]
MKKIKKVPLNKIINDLTTDEKKIVEEEKKYFSLVNTLRKLRLEKGFTQEYLAKKSNIPRTTIVRIESGERNATLNTLISMAHGLGKELDIRLV